MLLSAINQHWPRRPISLSCMETCMMFLPHPKVSIWAQSESHPLLMTTDIAPWMHMEAQLAPAKDQLFCVLVVRKPVCETLSERRGQWVLEIPQLCRVSLVFIHICKNVFQASCTVISNLYCSLLAVLTTYVANILLQIRKSVNDCKNQEFRTCMYLFFFFYIKALQLKVQGKNVPAGFVVCPNRCVEREGRALFLRSSPFALVLTKRDGQTLGKDSGC